MLLECNESYASETELKMKMNFRITEGSFADLMKEVESDSAKSSFIVEE